MNYAPVLITTLCRYEHFARLLESLKANSWAKYTDVYIGLDYPPSEKYQNGWNVIVTYLGNGDFSTFNSFIVIKREKNYGFEKNADDLLNQLQSKYDRFIVLEDDLELSPNYLEYMNKCLDAFEDDPSVVAVTGYSYPVKWDVSEGATCMKQNFNAAAWGRGFWKSKRAVYSEYISSGQMLRDIDKVIAEKSYKKMIDAAANLGRAHIRLFHDGQEYTSYDEDSLEFLFPTLEVIVFDLAISVDSIDVYDDFISLKLNEKYCPLHYSKYPYFYCYTCGKSICTECIFSNAHKGHNYKEKYDYLQSGQELVSQLFRDLNDNIKGADDKFTL